MDMETFHALLEHIQFSAVDDLTIPQESDAVGDPLQVRGDMG